jgi:HAD superfamily hydrolase (TIGR01484 family)
MSITRTLLASDLDGTLIPLERTPQRLAEVRELVTVLDGLDLAYVTGRHLSLGLEGIAEVGLPRPDWFVCDVGTSVYRRSGDDYELDQSYRARMREALGGLTGPELVEALGAVDGIWLQEEEKQAEFKVSYYTEGRHEAFVDTVRDRLIAAGASVNLVASFDPVSKRGLLDLLPENVAKDSAVHHLAKVAGVGLDSVIYAGDSGNDRAAMLSGARAIVVGNADEALKSQLSARAAEQGLTELIYFASKPYAAGVHEGILHFLGAPPFA